MRREGDDEVRCSDIQTQSQKLGEYRVGVGHGVRGSEAVKYSLKNCSEEMETDMQTLAKPSLGDDPRADQT